MFFDVYMIILTGFAVLGLFFLGEICFAAYTSRYSPPSVTVMLYSEGAPSVEKMRLIHNIIPNNHIVFITESDTDCTYINNVQVCRLCEISEYMKDVLFTKNTR